MSEGGVSPSERLNPKAMEPKQSANPGDLIDPLKARLPDRHQDKKANKKKKLLSFQDEEESEQEETHLKIRKNTNTKKDQGDKGMSKAQNLQEKLKEQFKVESERIREELIELEFSYWDGPNVVKKIRRKKKTSVRQFLEVCRLDLVENFQNIASVEARDLLFIIKDFIAPHQITIGDVELLKLKTAKNDLLLNLRHVKIKDITLSINLDGPIRIIERSHYQKNKANYPFCNWHTLNLREK